MQSALILGQLGKTEKENKWGFQGNAAEITKVDNQKASPVPIRTLLASAHNILTTSGFRIIILD